MVYIVDANDIRNFDFMLPVWFLSLVNCTDTKQMSNVTGFLVTPSDHAPF